MHHFPDFLSALQNMSKYNTDPDFKTKVLSKASRAILELYGTQNAKVIDKLDFNKLGDQILCETSQYNKSLFEDIQTVLIQEILEEKFLSIDHERIEIRQKKHKPTKFERNDRRRERERLLNKMNEIKNKYLKGESSVY